MFRRLMPKDWQATSSSRNASHDRPIGSLRILSENAFTASAITRIR